MLHRSRFLLLMHALLAGCVSSEQTTSAPASRIAIYSPPVTLGGRGSVIFVPAAGNRPEPYRRALEAPDPSPLLPTSAWLVGPWLHSASREDIDRIACNSGTVFTYEQDGSTSFWEGAGRWQLNGNRLTETITEANEDIIDPKELDVGTPKTVELWRVGPDEGAYFEDGKWHRMLRCRASDFSR